MNSKNSSKPARVRFAPSPTGLTHLGSARTALFNYLIAQQTQGQFILRIEDTDQKRFDPQAEDDLKNSLKWLGLDWDEGPDIGGPHAPYRQSERTEIYRQHAEILVEGDNAFYCFCTPAELDEVRKAQQKRKEHPHYSGVCRLIGPEKASKRVSAGESHIVRFKAPKEGKIKFSDYLRGEIEVENRTIDDKILLKSDGHALYHLAAMVDDHLMEITHVFRGEEWLPSLPLHAHLYQAFGWDQPVWVHLSVFLKPSGKGKMSKRDTEQMKLGGKSIFVKDLEVMGYLPEGVNNWIALMGWSYDDHTEFFAMQDLIAKFNLDGLNPSPAAIDFKKLDHFNGLHIRKLSETELSQRLAPLFKDAGYDVTVEQLQKVAPLIQTRMATLDEGPQLAGFLFKDSIEVETEDFLGKNMTAEESMQAVKRSLKLLNSLSAFTAIEMEAPMRNLAEELGLKAGQLFGILRNAVTGQKVSPPLFESMELVGQEIVLQRLETAIQQLKTHITVD
jgi:glutamyl-tRNA synthetase